MMRLIFTLLFFLTIICSKAQDRSSAKAITMLNKFYTAYLSEFSGSYNLHTSQHNLLSLRKKYCTSTCLKQYQKLVEQTDADPLIKAQDCDISLLKTLHINRNLKKNNLYMISYVPINKNNEKVVINLIVINQKGVPKIASFE
jgi:hypothetical protein